MQTITLRKISFTLLLLFGIFFSNKLQANIIYVDSASTGLNNGSSWTNAYTNFQTGINAANAGDSVWVAKGTYQPALDTSFSMKSGVKIYGGFAGTETSFSQRNLTLGDTSILKGNNNRVINNSNVDSNAVLDGFKIMDGTATGLNGNGFTNGTNGYGGGIYNYHSSPALSNLIFCNNSAQGGMGGTASTGGNGYGGGMYDTSSSPILINITFNCDSANGGTSYGNGSGGGNGYGGGLYNAADCLPVLTNIIFSNNVAKAGASELASRWGDGYGGGMYNIGSPSLTNVTFSNNRAMGSVNVNYPLGTGAAYLGHGMGGGMYNINPSISVLTNVTFTSNTVYGSMTFGGGMYNTNASPVLTNVVFTSNSNMPGWGGGDTYGGGMYNSNGSPTLTNVKFLNNHIKPISDGIYASYGWGGGMYNINAASPILTNVLFSNNSSNGSDVTGGWGYGGGMCNINSSPVLINTLFYKDSANSGNNFLYGGESFGKGGGIYNSSSSPTLMNITFSNNAATGYTNSYGGAIENESSSPIITNCVFWGDTAKTGNDIANISSTPIVTYSFTQTAIAGVGNIQGSLDPFADTAHPAGIDGIFMTLDDGLHISPISAAFNSGRNDSIPAGITTDITDTTIRILDSVVEMGAYETKLSSAPVISSFAPTSDCGNDTVVISGQNFAGDPAVSFGGIPVAFSTVVNDSTIKAVAGNGASGTISISTSGGTATTGGLIYTAPFASSVSIAANSADTICAGTNVTFTATATNGGTPSYQWKLNGVNVGSNSATYNTDSLSNHDMIYCVMTNTSGCVAPLVAISDSIIIAVNPINTASITIVAPADTICNGSTVTFTATVNHSGTHPSYQWQVNGINAGTDSSVFTTSALSNGNSIKCIVTSNATCTANATDTSNNIVITVNPTVIPSIHITSSASTICSGSTVTFTATTTNGGSNPSYQWQVNGINAGTDSSVFTTSALSNGNSIKCIVTSNATCTANATDTSNNIVITVNPTVIPSINITSSANTICSGSAATFTATTTNGGSNPSYQWQVNGTNAGTDSSGFTTSALANGNAITCIVTNNAACASNLTDTSNAIAITVNSTGILSANINSSANTICSGSTVTFTATTTNGGSNPSYQWQVNGIHAGTDSAGFTTSALSNGNTIKCIVTSNATCTANSTDTSNNIVITVNPIVSPAVTITADTNNICSGTPVIFTARTLTGGNTPSYQWMINGDNVGTNDSVYTSNDLQDGNVISCLLTSSMSCAIPSLSNNNITMTVYALPSVANGIDTIRLGGSTILSLSTTGDIASYWWSPADSLYDDTAKNPVVNPGQNTTYTLRVTTVNGCTASGEMSVILLSGLLSIPNVFTPNGDGHNDTWQVYNIGGAILSVDVYVYTNNGELVYQATNYQNNWNGTYNGKPLPDGTYFYYAIVHYPDYNSTITGNVTIIR